MNTATTRAEISFVASIVTFIAALVVWLAVDPVAAGAFLDGGATDWSRGLWWGSAGAVLIILWRRTEDMSDNIPGTLLCMVLGPITLLALGYQELSYKLFPIEE